MGSTLQARSKRAQQIESVPDIAVRHNKSRGLGGYSYQLWLFHCVTFRTRDRSPV
jgi:hypothetical protein